MGAMSKLHIKHATDARSGAMLMETIMTRADDIPRIHGPPDYQRVRTMTARVISDPQYALFVASVDDDPILFIAGYVCEELHNYNLYGCVDFVLAPNKVNTGHVMEKALHDSFDKFARWAFDKGAKRITAGHTSMSTGAKTLGKLLPRWGYTSIGEVFVLEAE